ncbi:hypothetical protein [Serpentinicella alkaliphila]|uniref:Uncharacterized protein n=1 Tax=Serpentinicella alkaliphila TaxID=1734049 RepID=A0A4R2TJW5_9FIRM|nr:hypothetical protein [Serpentinicella alkaliphila]QUH25525.1 hypothetical protein HZR23_06965 [Serpentinicella alkaliphila]TCP95132.1 hypothetical protein EDD79_10641 [Serpentinicella alkaliphila]
MRERLKSIKIVDELINYCYNLGISQIHVDLEDVESAIKITVEGFCDGIAEEELQSLNDFLSIPRQEEVEEYYWELIGEGNKNELALVGMVIDDGQAIYSNKRLNITVLLKK